MIGSVAVVVSMFGGAVLSTQTARAAGDCTVPAAETTMDSEEQQVLSLINDYRRQKGLTPFAASGSLVRGAAWKAKDYGTRQWRGNEDPHVDTLGRLPHIMNIDCGFAGRVTGENLAAGHPTPSAVVEAWKASPAHNQNMLRANFIAAGVGRHSSASSYGIVWTLEMGDSVDSGTPTVSQPTPTPTVSQATPTPTVVRPASTPATGAAAQIGGSVAPQVQMGTVVITVALVDANGQSVSGDRSGYVFTLTGASTHTTAATNTQGQTSLAVPTGLYTLTEQVRSGSTLRSVAGGGASANTVVVNAGQLTTVTATNQVTPAPAPATAQTQASNANPTVGVGGANPTVGGTAMLTNGSSLAATTMPAGNALATTALSNTSTATQTVHLTTGCTNIVLTWPALTPLSMIVGSVSTQSAITGVWRYDPETGRFAAYSPGATSISDYQVTRQSLEAAFVCTASPITLDRPLMR